MLKLVRFATSLLLLAAAVWFGATVPLGKATLFGHLRRIWQAEETQDLVQGAHEKIGPTVERAKKVLDEQKERLDGAQP
ncbi:MAG: hypothetical protein V2A73_06895 [Pseudomonadota bacterium]